MCSNVLFIAVSIVALGGIYSLVSAIGERFGMPCQVMFVAVLILVILRIQLRWTMASYRNLPHWRK